MIVTGGRIVTGNSGVYTNTYNQQVYFQRACVHTYIHIYVYTHMHSQVRVRFVSGSNWCVQSYTYSQLFFSRKQSIWPARFVSGLFQEARCVHSARFVSGLLHEA